MVSFRITKAPPLAADDGSFVFSASLSTTDFIVSVALALMLVLVLVLLLTSVFTFVLALALALAFALALGFISMLEES